MWAILYHFRQRGFRFRRQVNIGSYYADFACLTPAIVIEVDGATHTTEQALGNDAVRDEYFRTRGFRVLRFWNNDVMGNPDGVFTLIDAALIEASAHSAPPTPDPSPQGAGRRNGRGVAR
jgi:very-short-patch-repair endonuclease